MSEPFRDSLHVNSRDRFAEKLSHHQRAHAAMQTDTLFHVQAETVGLMLDVIDQVTDRMTAFRIADAIADRWAADFDARIITEAEYRAWTERIMPRLAAEFTEQLADVLPEGVRFEWGGDGE
ncbi:MAG TPA: hypothetical protein VGS19_23890 [Streptosporangiaceae bacterium]|nr:hypothetical protein [Streptosporangiaceae bacterium]